MIINLKEYLENFGHFEFQKNNNLVNNLVKIANYSYISKFTSHLAIFRNENINIFVLLGYY